MIRIDRGPEPPSLRRTRRCMLARAQLARIAGTSIEFEGYQSAKGELFKRQHQKCAYCERLPGEGSQPVEHHRPKSGADRGDPSVEGSRGKTVDAQHCWWLAWTWENLLFACVNCNGQNKKGNWFGVEPGTSALGEPDVRSAEVTAASFDLASERPMLLDPTRDDPLDHIAWTPTNPDDDPEKLLWEPRPVTARGAYTIAAIKLRHDLPDAVNAHIRVHVWLPWLRDVVARREKPRSAEKWRQMTTELLLPGAQYAAATYDALCWFRRRNAMSDLVYPLSRPGAPVVASVQGAVVDADPPELAALPHALRLEVRAERSTQRDRVLRLLAHAPWTCASLASALGLSPSRARGILRELEAEERVVEAAGAWSLDTRGEG